MSEGGHLGGIFGEIVQAMIEEACGFCENGHGATTIRFDSNGKNMPARKQNLIGVQNDIDVVPQISFPVNGILDDQKYMERYAFVPILESPGVAFITLPDVDTVSNSVVTSVVQCWPVILTSMLMAVLSGGILWFAVLYCLFLSFNT